MTSGAVAAAHTAMAPRFEQNTGHRVVTLATSTGVGADSIASRVRRGEPVDVVILARAALDALIAEGLVVGTSRVDLARSGIGVAVRKGSAHPDISSVEALTNTLRRAKSVAYSASVSGVYLSTELFPRLGVAEQMSVKGRRIENERVGAVIARGEAEIGFQQTSELLEITGIDYVGPLPDEVQRITVFSAAIATSAPRTDLARAFLAYLVSAAGVEAMKKSGLDPIVGSR